ncbi:6-phospho-3-hexuloisomerase [Virgibacillus necropolis]|uniref:6-phospho-3-hexuloisomerase n=1 Tax=Virgibacillus necropolis TaxID=163877 RepID=UPI00384F1049
MKILKTIIHTVADEITNVLKQIDENEVIQLGNELQNANRIFISGTGRSGLIGKVFAMRLMQSGYQVFVVGETITPSIESDDLLIVISGSGSTGSLAQFAQKAKEVGAKLALVTTNRDSKIGQLSDCTLFIPAATKKREAHEPKTIQPLGSQFDQSAHLVLDALMVHLLQNKRDEQSNAQLNKLHANLE